MIDLKAAKAEVQNVRDMEQLEVFFQKYLGKQWIVTMEYKQMQGLDITKKKELGPQLTAAKDELTQAYELQKDIFAKELIHKQLQRDVVDSSLELPSDAEGSFSLLSNIRRDAEEVCKSMGFVIEYGTEVVTKFENFESVNIPLTHPATEMHDTIYLQDKDMTNENLILRTHTSSMQNYLIQKYGLPLRAVVPGRVYRYENMDAHHDVMFHQLEGIVIDKNISIAHFKDMMEKILSALLHKKVETRMRPGYFPFVEPGVEIDARYEIYNPQTGKKELSKWIELVGAGMIHPNVLKNAGIDTDGWRSWFAFGIGISRLAAIRYGIKDIRYFTNGDLRFAKSFS